MVIETRRAAQYIRMSTDRQDLSPLIQKDAIAAFASKTGFEIVNSYEDEGKSGVQLSNRPRLRQLLRDVTEGAPFTDILVYDVSRWGRFQDSDAAAYYEYHCRLHGVQVIYVCESFANDLTPASVLLKSMRRVMAAEYSRDLASKSRAGQERVVLMGFHMGSLPPLGYRRCSVSADGRRRKLLELGERKLSLTDRVEWVLGPEKEVALIRRICDAFCAGFLLEELSGLAQAEGWRTVRGRPVTTGCIKKLLANEALIGNFVWGVKSKGGKVITCRQTRMDGSIPRILDDQTWAAIQARLKELASQPIRPGKDLVVNGNSVPVTRARQLSLALQSPEGSNSYRRNLGSPQQLKNHTREMGRLLCAAITSAGLPVGFDTRNNVLTFWNARVRVRLMWPASESTWSMERHRPTANEQYVLVARLRSLGTVKDFFLVPTQSVQVVRTTATHQEVPRSLRSYWCRTHEELFGHLSELTNHRPAPHAR